MEDIASYANGAAHARKQQAQGIGNTAAFRDILLKAVVLRDALRESKEKTRMEAEIEAHLSGYLAQWD